MLSEVIQKAFVEVSEQGAEAAAAPAEQEEPAVFRVARPFVFLIRDRRTLAVLFLDRVADPMK